MGRFSGAGFPPRRPGVGVALVVVPLLAALAAASALHPGRASAAGSRRPPTRADPALFVLAARTLGAPEVAALARATGASRVELMDAGPVSIGAAGRRTDAVGVDPGTFRWVMPRGTAESTGLWQRIAAGDGAAAHAFAADGALPVGGDVAVRSAGGRGRVRLGALATTGLPGVGLVVDRDRAAALGLRHATAAALVVPRAVDPVVLAAAAAQAVPGTEVRPLWTVEATASRQTVASPGTGAVRGGGPPGPAPTMASGRAPTRASSPPPTRRPTPPPVLLPSSAPVTTSGWVSPASGPVTQGFDPPGHQGTDIGAPYGAPILAAADGEVVTAGPADGFGTWLVLQHAGGVRTVYGHMSALLVRGGHVRAGQPVALVGSEGNSTGPHLHFEVRVGGTPTDPVRWLRDRGVLLGSGP